MDKRVERTRRTIRKTLLSLMGERPVERITTTELCRKAHINRNTFYAHYSSPEDVLREVEDELIADIEQELRRGYEEGDVTLAIARYVMRNQELWRTLWRCKNSRLKGVPSTSSSAGVSACGDAKGSPHPTRGSSSCTSRRRAPSP